MTGGSSRGPWAFKKHCAVVMAERFARPRLLVLRSHFPHHPRPGGKFNGGQYVRKHLVPIAPHDAKWTVMVFMGAATINGNAPLIDAAEADLAEMRSVGSGGALNISCRSWLRERAPQQHLRHHAAGIDALGSVPEREAHPARGWALLNFIKSSLSAAAQPRQPQPLFTARALGPRIRFCVRAFDDIARHHRRARLRRTRPSHAGVAAGVRSPQAHSSISSASMRAVSRPSKWPASWRRLQSISSARRSVFRFLAFRTDRVLERLRGSQGHAHGPNGVQLIHRAALLCGDPAELSTVSLTLLDLRDTQKLIGAGGSSGADAGERE